MFVYFLLPQNSSEASTTLFFTAGYPILSEGTETEKMSKL
jgi:hypothetical protein